MRANRWPGMIGAVRGTSHALSAQRPCPQRPRGIRRDAARWRSRAFRRSCNRSSPKISGHFVRGCQYADDAQVVLRSRRTWVGATAARRPGDLCPGHGEAQQRELNGGADVFQAFRGRTALWRASAEGAWAERRYALVTAPAARSRAGLRPPTRAKGGCHTTHSGLL